MNTYFLNTQGGISFEAKNHLDAIGCAIDIATEEKFSLVNVELWLETPEMKPLVLLLDNEGNCEKNLNLPKYDETGHII